MKTKFILILVTGILIFSCNKDEDRSAPHLTTSSVSQIASYSARCGGNSILEGGILQKGVCWATDKLPDINDNKTSEGSGSDDYTSTLTNLQASTVYYVRAYATNKYRTGYGDVVQFTTSPPKFIKPVISGVTRNSASCNVGVLASGSTDSLGVCLATQPNPTKKDLVIIVGSKVLVSFNLLLQQLTPNTTYYLRAFSATKLGTDYSDVVSFTTYYNSVTDVHGYIYNTIKVGNQEWTVENLRTFSFQNNSSCQYVFNNPSTWINTSLPSYCYYQDFNSSELYGILYNWYAATDGRNIAPPGWHVATESDWESLFSALGGKETAGTKMKLNSSLFWNNSTSTNESSFSAVGGGLRYSTSAFQERGYKAAFWINDAGSPKYVVLESGSGRVSVIPNAPRNMGLNIRCVKN